MKIKHVFFIEKNKDPKLCEIVWRQGELDKFKGHYLPPSLDPEQYICEFYYEGIHSLEQAAHAVNDYSDLIISHMDLFCANSDSLSKSLPILREKNAIVQIIESNQIFNLSENSVWSVFKMMTLALTMAKSQKKEDEEEEEEEKESEGLHPKKKITQFAQRMFNTDQIRTMRLMRKSGSSYGEIAKSFNCSRRTAYEYTHDVTKSIEKRKNMRGWAENLHELIIRLVPDDSEFYYALKSYFCTFGKASTQSNVIMVLKNFIFWIYERRGEKPQSPRDISKEQLMTYIWERQKTVSSSMTHVSFYTIRKFFNHCLENQFADENIFKDIKAPYLQRTKTVRSHDLDEEELARLLKYLTHVFQSSDKERCPIQYYGSFRNLVMVMIYVTTGMRCTEVRGLRLKNFAMEKDTVIITTLGKKGNQVVRRLDQKVSALLMRYSQEFRSGMEKNTYMFSVSAKDMSEMMSSSVNYAIRNAAKKAGIQKPISVHSMRTTVATLAAKAGMPLLELQRRLGHSSPEQTMAYIRRLEVLKDNSFIPSFIGTICEEVAHANGSI